MQQINDGVDGRGDAPVSLPPDEADLMSLGPPMALTELSLGAEGTLSVFRAFFRGVLGDDWEAKLVAAGAAPPDEATDEDLVAARFRAVEVMKAARPDLEWTDDLEDMVDEAWWTLWVHVE